MGSLLEIKTAPRAGTRSVLEHESPRARRDEVEHFLVNTKEASSVLTG